MVLWEILQELMFYFVAILILLPLIVFGGYIILRVSFWAIETCINDFGRKVERDRTELDRKIEMYKKERGE